MTTYSKQYIIKLHEEFIQKYKDENLYYTELLTNSSDVENIEYYKNMILINNNVIKAKQKQINILKGLENA